MRLWKLVNEALLVEDLCWEQDPSGQSLSKSLILQGYWAHNPFGHRPMIDRNHMLAINPIWTKIFLEQKRAA